jgi:FixJ family two-component response regulator
MIMLSATPRPENLKAVAVAAGGGYRNPGTLHGASATCDDASMSDTSAVYVVDDDPSMLRAIDSLLRSVGQKTRPYGSVSEFLAKRPPQIAGCLILDVRLPGISGLDLQGQLKELGIRIPVILMTGHGDIRMTVQAMKAGAVDFLTKPFRDQDMLDAVARALEQDATRREEDLRISSLRETFSTLSPRERQVIQLVVAGRLNKQVASELELSQITVKIHRSSAMRKMGARNFADLVRMIEALRRVGCI